MKKGVYCILCVLAVAGTVSAVCFFAGRSPEKTAEKEKIITGYGYIRGRGCTGLKNKYGAYVKKVYFYSDSKVKKGDCILEYDDYDLRQKITAAENSVANLEKELALQQTKLELTRLDPLPSDYRNINWKSRRARELMELTRKEWETYKVLYVGKSVSELEMRAKKQAYEDALASLESTLSDQNKVKHGLKTLYLRQAEENVALLETKLAGLKKELDHLYEQRKFYRIVTPYDGIIVTNSDTVHAWNDAGTTAANIHNVRKGYYIYSYFEEKDIIHLPNGTKGKFFSTDTGKYYDLISFDTTQSRTAVGDKVFHLVKFKVLSPVEKGVTMEGAGVVHVKISGKI